MAYLTIEYPDGKETRIMLLRKSIIIGRSPDVDICIDAEWVSGEHAELMNDAEVYSIKDLGSSNGTYLNYQRVEKADLSDNDLIFLGRTKILFRNGASELEESAVELDILSEDQSGVFTRIPPEKEIRRKAFEPAPTLDEVTELLKAHETSDRINIAAFNKDGFTLREPTAKDLKRLLREAQLQIATLEVEVDRQRKRLELEIERLMKELTVWKSRYFDRVEESKKLRRQIGPANVAKTKKFDSAKLESKEFPPSVKEIRKEENQKGEGPQEQEQSNVDAETGPESDS
jgi:pSer/pThr/pTyr-binding forkhead associated (FHA) protein